MTHDWSRKLPEPIKVGRRTLRTLHDVSQFLLALPPEMQEQKRVQHVARVAMDAAEGKAEPMSVVVAFKIAGLHR